MCRVAVQPDEYRHGGNFTAITLTLLQRYIAGSTQRTLDTTSIRRRWGGWTCVCDAVQPYGKIIIGRFDGYNGTVLLRWVATHLRTLDSTFNPSIPGANGDIAVALQQTGRS